MGGFRYKFFDGYSLVLFEFAVKVQRVVRQFEMVYRTGIFDNLTDALVLKLNYFSGLYIDKMVVLDIGQCLFELGNILAELVFDDQLTFEQQLNGIVERGTADTVVLVFHRNIKGFDVEMAFARIDFVENGEAFGGFPVPLLLEVFCKQILYGLFVFLYAIHT